MIGSRRWSLFVAFLTAVLLAAGVFAWNGCGGDTVVEGDGGKDSGPKDTGPTDGETDAEGEDAETPADASDAALDDGGHGDASDGGDTGVGDAGDAGDAGPKPDAGKPGVIIPGTGVQVWTTDSTKQSLNVMASTYKNVTDALGAGVPDSNIQYYIRWNNFSLDGLFVNSAGGDTVVDGSLLNQIVLRDDFNGRTAAGNGLGTPRATWQTEMGTPNHSYVSGGETVDLYFKTGTPVKKGGLSVVYDGSGNATQIAVFKPTQQVPSAEIAWDVPSVFDIKAGLTSGTSFSSVISKFGNADIDSIKTVDSVEMRTLTYLQLGLTFTGATSNGKVATIAIIAPYYGKLKYGTAGLGSLHTDVTAFFNGRNDCCNTADDCATKAKCAEAVTQFSYSGKTVNVYYYKIKMETVLITNYYITVGFIYGSSAPYTDQATTILLGLPIKK